MFLLASTTWSGMTTSSGLSAAMRALAFLWATKVAPRSLNGFASDVIEMAVAVNDVFDRRLSHRLDRVGIGLRRPPFTNRVGGDHARGRDDEHRLMAAITENVDIVR